MVEQLSALLIALALLEEPCFVSFLKEAELECSSKGIHQFQGKPSLWGGVMHPTYPNREGRLWVLSPKLCIWWDPGGVDPSLCNYSAPPPKKTRYVCPPRFASGWWVVEYFSSDWLVPISDWLFWFDCFWFLVDCSDLFSSDFRLIILFWLAAISDWLVLISDWFKFSDWFFWLD